MKQLAKKMLLMGALVAGSSASAGEMFDFDCMTPYVGIDYQQRWMNTERSRCSIKSIQTKKYLSWWFCLHRFSLGLHGFRAGL